tara:strand:- start:261 stop:959 length:699 start_codon:yes stop_codon:yes gene_type:complete
MGTTSEKEGTAVELAWRSDKLGDGIQLDSSCKTVSRHSKSGYGVQLTDAWLTKDITTVAIECQQLTEDCCIGIVGRNYNPGDWNGNLMQSSHAVVLHCASGRVSFKGAETNFVLRPLVTGARLVLTIDMQTREVTFELMGASGSVESSLIVEGLPAELAVAACFGPGEQRVRLAACEMQKPEKELLGKMVKDLWDEENIVPPLQHNVRSDDSVQTQQRKVNDSVAAVALGMQ